MAFSHFEAMLLYIISYKIALVHYILKLYLKHCFHYIFTEETQHIYEALIVI